MRVAILRIKERSWEINTMLPWKSSKKFSNHSIASTSKWLVGSSSNNTSGSHTNARASAALRNQPPESADNFVVRFCIILQKLETNVVVMLLTVKI